ncbi:MAG: VOC family protein [Candidatus Nanoarchaeia archaeon]|jgi:catechol 2,3-dioxygenase-like lactoylglutathione lyase family enzyme|nr:VOC family protein [Candidatus Nanoarchaeia archaeon]
MNVRHCGMFVKDLIKSVNFYKQLGFVEYYNNIEKWNYFGELKISKLKSENGFNIELIESDKVNELNDKHHIALEVENVDDIYNKLKDNFNFIITPTISPDGSAKVAFFKGYENYIELVEIL